jgi:hypothetical protein
MNDSTIYRTEEETLSYDVSDEELEATASAPKDKGGSFTISFCSGLDTCPA